MVCTPEFLAHPNDRFLVWPRTGCSRVSRLTNTYFGLVVEAEISSKLVCVEFALIECFLGRDLSEGVRLDSFACNTGSDEGYRRLCPSLASPVKSQAAEESRVESEDHRLD